MNTSTRLFGPGPACRRCLAALAEPAAPMQGRVRARHLASAALAIRPRTEPSAMRSRLCSAPLQPFRDPWLRKSFSTSKTARQEQSEAQEQRKQCTNPSCRDAPALPLSALSCPACESLQPLPSSLSYYALFYPDRHTQLSLRDKWEVREAELKATWRRTMALTHPDRMGGRSEREQAIAEQQSSFVNKAYETLRKPLSRAVYLLEEHGGADAAISESDALDDPELLMAVMEARETLEDASSEEEVGALRAQNGEHLQAALTKIGGLLSESHVDWSAVKAATVELRYWSNIDDACNQWQPGKPIALQH